MPNHTDFNGDGFDDILWRSNYGDMREWLGQANGSFSNNPAVSQMFPLDWFIAGTGDFNGDGYDDVLFRNLNDARIINWLGNANGSFTLNTSAIYQVGAEWHVAATGDFNGDDREDLLLRNINGTITEWTGNLNGGFSTNHVNSTYNLDTSWSVVGAGDFNGDNRDDLLLRLADGTVTGWLGSENGSFTSNHEFATYRLDNSWSLVGTGDFNGDNRDDLVLLNNEGTLTEWLGKPNGGFVSNHEVATYQLGIDWHVIEVGDYNGDSRDDLLLRNSGGSVTNWLAQSDGSFASNHLAATYQDYAWTWQVQPNPSGAGTWDY